MDDLKRCPFCGSVAVILYDLDLAPSGVMCGNPKCGTVVHYLGIKPAGKREPFERVLKEIAERWNRRSV